MRINPEHITLPLTDLVGKTIEDLREIFGDPNMPDSEVHGTLAYIFELEAEKHRALEKVTRTGEERREDSQRKTAEEEAEYQRLTKYYSSIWNPEKQQFIFQKDEKNEIAVSWNSIRGIFDEYTPLGGRIYHFLDELKNSSTQAEITE